MKPKMWITKRAGCAIGFPSACQSEWQNQIGSRRAFIAAGPEVEWREVKSRAKYDDKKHTLVAS